MRLLRAALMGAIGYAIYSKYRQQAPAPSGVVATTPDAPVTGTPPATSGGTGAGE